MIESHNRRELEDQRKQLLFSEVANIQLGDIIAAMFSKDAKIKSVQELVPELFDGLESEEQRQEREWREHMQKMREYTSRYNQKRKEE